MYSITYISVFPISIAPPPSGSGAGSVNPAWTHLGADVLKWGRVDQREADEEDVRLRVGERPQSVVVLLTRRVPQAQVDGLPVHHHVGGVVVEPAGRGGGSQRTQGEGGVDVGVGSWLGVTISRIQKYWMPNHNSKISTFTKHKCTLFLVYKFLQWSLVGNYYNNPTWCNLLTKYIFNPITYTKTGMTLL